MIIKDTEKNIFLHTSFDYPEEADLYYSLRDYLNRAEIEINTTLLHRYCRIQFQWIELFKKNKQHYMLDKYATHLECLEESLCLTPKSMLAYQKDKVLIDAKKQKTEKGKK